MRKDYNIDIIFCIDTSRSMQSCVDTLRARMPQLWQDLHVALKAAWKEVNQARLKLICFGIDDKETFTKESIWFKLGNNNGIDDYYLNAFLKKIKCVRPSNYSNALEALSMAIQNDWVQTGDKWRHVIVIFTDSAAQKLEDANRSNPNYPENIPASFEELTDIWMTPSSSQQSGTDTKLKQPAKRLVVFAPQVYPWPELYESWDQVVYNPSKAGAGLVDVSFEDIINAIAGSV